MKSKQIVFINQSSGYLMIDIVEAFADQYTDRVLITGFLNPRNRMLDPKVRLESITPYDRNSTVRRLFTWFWAFLQIVYLVKVKYRKAFLFLVTNPPLAVFLPLLFKNRFSLLVFDIYPDALVEYGIFKNDSGIVRYWKNVNRRVFHKAENIFTVSDGMKSVLSEYVEANKIKVVPIWTDNEFLMPIPKEKNKFIAKYGLENKFLVIYSGNLGYTHDLEVLVDLAEKMRHLNILFLIIGEGEKKAFLQQKIDRLNLTNCLMLPWQETEMLPHSLSAADLGVVSLGKEASKLSVPSKTYNLMSVGAPLLCIADQTSELATLVDQLEIGQCFTPDQIDKMEDYVELLTSNQTYHQQLKENALKASMSYGPENAFRFVNIG